MVDTAPAAVKPQDLHDDELALIGKAVCDALRFHKSIGNPVVESRDGKVVWVAPEDIMIPEE